MNPARLLQRRNVALREANGPDLALCDQFCQRANALPNGDPWIGSVQLVEINNLNAQAAQRSLTRGLQMRRRAIAPHSPRRWISDHQPTLRRQHNLLPSSLDGLSNDLLAGKWP